MVRFARCLVFLSLHTLTTTPTLSILNLKSQVTLGFATLRGFSHSLYALREQAIFFILIRELAFGAPFGVIGKVLP